MKLIAKLHIHCSFTLLTIALLISCSSIAQEVCNNAIDDDNDGLIDLFDPDCQCHFTVNGNLLLNASFEKDKHCPVTYIYDSEYDIATDWKFSSYTNINEANFY